jgi:hypothetical protein
VLSPKLLTAVVVTILALLVVVVVVGLARDNLDPVLRDRRRRAPQGERGRPAVILLAVVAVASFVAGVVVGHLLRDALEILRTGKGFVVDDCRNALGRVRMPEPRTVGIALVIAVLAVNATVGFLLIATRGQLVDLADCVADHSQDQTESLEARDKVAKDITREESYLWRDYVDAFDEAVAADDAGDQARVEELQLEFRDRLEAYSNDLSDLNDTRDANPYPDPERCRRLVP